MGTGMRSHYALIALVAIYLTTVGNTDISIPDEEVASCR
jgi:hypothetical protein